MDLRLLLVIALGGGAGSIARHLASTTIQHAFGATLFPWGILFVNLAGCLAIGMVAQTGESTGLFSPLTRAMIVTGFLGGFTTYSTFANQSVELANGGLGWQSFTYVALHILGGLGAVWLGRMAVLRVIG